MYSLLIRSLLDISSSSPPQPQNILENPLTYCTKKVILDYNIQQTFGTILEKKFMHNSLLMYLFEMIHSHCRYPTKNIIVRKMVKEVIDCHRHVPWLYWTAMNIGNKKVILCIRNYQNQAHVFVCTITNL